MNNLLPESVASLRTMTIPSPQGGLNVFDNLITMPPSDAIKLNNIVPQPWGCIIRKGYQVHKSGISGPVESLGSWASRGGPIKLFAFGNGAMYDATNSGVIGAALISGLLSDYWQSVSFANVAGTHTVFVDGTDDPIWYSDSGAQRLIAGDGIASGTIKDVDPKTFIQVTSHQRRLWFVPVNDTRGWFLPPDSIFGVASYFDFGPFFRRGGYLSTLANWSVDAGDGSNDKLVAVSSLGEAVVFQGTDVTNASTWQLVGTYFIGAPVRGRRYYTNVAGDLLYLTSNGIVSMASMLVSTQVNESNSSVYSKKIQFLLGDLTTSLFDLEGWELVFFPAISLLIINIPTIYSGTNGQLVNNTITNAWCTFSDMDARCWHRVGGMPYFGAPDGKVHRAWIGHKDNVNTDGTGGTNIIAKSQQAYTNFNNPTTQKQVGLYRPIFMGPRKIGYSSKIVYDYLTPILNLPTSVGSSSLSAEWGEALWGDGIWSGGHIVQREWNSAEGMGVAVSLMLNLSSEVETTWIATDYTLKSGGPL